MTPPRPHPTHRRFSPALAVLTALFALTVLLPARPASAIPAFSRKYETSCTTCHTIYPKLNPFGEAFRRNGYRFPGDDSDYWQAKTVPLGRDAYKKQFPNTVWPGVLFGSVPIAVGFNGQAIIHPTTGSTAAQADNGTVFNLDNLVEEGHIWAGGNFDATNTYFGEMTIGSDGAEVEKAMVLLNDLVGPQHAVNLIIGKGTANASSFAPHSSYMADAAIPMVMVTGLYGAKSDSWAFNDNHNGLELNGVLAGRFDYSAGIQAGTNTDVRPTENVYAHVGFKFGGMRLDGEHAAPPSNPMRPWEENALTVDLFGYHSNSRYTDAESNDVQDTARTLGGSLRAQLGSLELDAGAYQEHHNRASDTLAAVDAFVQYDELDYLVYPWLAAGARFEYLSVTPDKGTTVSTWRIDPGLEFAVRANFKLSLIGDIEQASGTPPGGWGDAADGAAIVPSSATANVSPEFESLTLGAAWAF